MTSDLMLRNELALRLREQRRITLAGARLIRIGSACVFLLLEGRREGSGCSMVEVYGCEDVHELAVDYV
jgi:hypothetical protein